MVQRYWGPLKISSASVLLLLSIFAECVSYSQVVSTLHHNSTLVDAADEGSGEVEGTDASELLSDTEPHLVVKDSKGQPCLLATLNATMQVSYQVQEGLVHQTYMAVADIQLPEDVQSWGVCGENSSSLLLHWGNNDTFVVNMTFFRKDSEKDNDNATWSMTSLSIRYDLSDRRVFPGASDKQEVTVERHDLKLFESWDGYSYVCDRDISCHVGTVDRGVDVTFHEVHLAAFGVTTSEFPTASVYCSDTDDGGSDDDILVPLIVACVLSALVVIIVIGYVISRKVQEAREQSEYRPMP